MKLDGFLRGGVAAHGITEIAGESGSGKTQLCLQMTMTVQYPVSCGGFNGGKCLLCSQVLNEKCVKNGIAGGYKPFSLFQEQFIFVLKMPFLLVAFTNYSTRSPPHSHSHRPISVLEAISSSNILVML